MPQWTLARLTPAIGGSAGMRSGASGDGDAMPSYFFSGAASDVEAPCGSGFPSAP
jgi:hypothetical protein